MILYLHETPNDKRTWQYSTFNRVSETKHISNNNMEIRENKNETYI
jgi:hypothetical protein